MAKSNALVKYQKSGGDLTILPDNDRYKNRFEIKSETSNRLYVVAQNKNTGAWSCGCFGWIRYRRCKHLSTLQPLLENVDRENKSTTKRLR